MKFLISLAVLLLPLSALQADNLADSDTLFDYAEAHYPQLFSPAGQTTNEPKGYVVRH